MTTNSELTHVKENAFIYNDRIEQSHSIATPPSIEDIYSYEERRKKKERVMADLLQQNNIKIMNNQTP